MAAIPISKPFIRRKDMDAVLSCLVNDEIGPGRASTRLEKQIGPFFGGKTAIALREYGRAVEIALRALDLPGESAIAVSPLVHPVYPVVARSLGYRVVLIDVTEDSPVMPVEGLAEHAAEVAAVVVDTPLGLAANLPEILRLGLPVIEDVSTGFGTTVDEKPVGSFGHIAVLGLEATDMLTAAGGAVVVAREKRVAGGLRQLAENLLPESRLSDLNAALGVTQLAEFQKQLTRREELGERLSRSLLRGRHRTPPCGEAVVRVWPFFPVLLDGSLKDAAVYARKHGVETETSFSGSFLARHATAEEAASVVRAQGLLLRTLSFPLYPRLGREQVATIERVLATLP